MIETLEENPLDPEIIFQGEQTETEESFRLVLDEKNVSDVSLNINTEINLGAIVPISLGKHGNKLPLKKKYSASFVDSLGSIHHQSAEVHAKDGPLSGLTHRVLGVITTLAVNGLKSGVITPNRDGDMYVPFSITQICQGLGKKANGGNRNNIVKAISALRNCDINYKNFVCGKDEVKWHKKDIMTSIIKDVIKESRGTKSETYLVQISAAIVSSLMADLYISTDRETFLALDDAEMRIHQIIEIKKKQMGSEFVVDLVELAEQFGVYHKNKQSYNVNKYLKRYQEKTPEMEYSIKQVKSVKSVLFIFKDRKQIEYGDFYSDLLKFYDLKDLESLDLSEDKTKSLLLMYPLEMFKIDNKEVNKAELIIDLILFQFKFQDAKITYLNKYFSKLFHEKDLLLPTGFKDLKTRTKLKKDSEARVKIIEKRQQKNKEEEIHRQELYNKAGMLLEKIRLNNVSQYEEMKLEALENMNGITEDDNLYQLSLEEEMKKLSIEYMEKGKLK